MMSKRIIFILYILLISFKSQPSKAQHWVRVGYFSYEGEDEFPIPNIDSSHFTHLICGFVDLNSTSYKLSLSESDLSPFSIFTKTVKKKNPSVATLLSIGRKTNTSVFSSMASDSIYRKSFIASSIKMARFFGFKGLDLWWVNSDLSYDMSNLGILFEEWQHAITLEARNSTGSKLILTAEVNYSPSKHPFNFPLESINQHLDWVHVRSCDAMLPDLGWTMFTAAPMALYNPSSTDCSTDLGITAWIEAGLPAKKIVMFLPYFGAAWTLADPKVNGIGAPATGKADVKTTYKDIKNNFNLNRAKVTFDKNYVVNYFTMGTSWIAFDDVESIQKKVSYAKEKGLLGYFVWQVAYDDNWVLSQAAAGQEDNNQRVLVIISTTTAAVILLLGILIYYCCFRFKMLKSSKGKVNSAKDSKNKRNSTAAGDFNINSPNLIEYNLTDIEVATHNFSIENKLGEGGYGPVYKGVLDGQEIAVKKLSKTSKQGSKEFGNEVMLTVKVQHINLVKLLGFCTDKKEQMLVYEYMPNKSLDHYLFGPNRHFILDWKRRLDIIEGVTQGLIYLQEYSRLTIIHRDLKASNILLDENMKPKISDFGMARIFTKDDLEANTEHIAGTPGYVSPEYFKEGIYSTKSDVYSFGVLLLQIISGKNVSISCGENDDISLLDYAYKLWKDDKGMDFMDTSLDDTFSSCKLMTCLQIALLCVQETPNDRPTMIEVFSMLKNEATCITIPKKPAFSRLPDENEQNKSAMHSEVCSVNDTTMSEVVAR